MREVTRAPETWLPVVGYEGLYEVSDLGRLRSLARTVSRKDGRRVAVRQRLKSLSPGFGGYVDASLWRNNSDRRVRVHTLVLEAFVGPPPPGMECRHIDGNPSNNCLTNLQWGTSSENKWDRVRHGNHPAKNRQNCPLGHPLVAPNLTSSSMSKGHRNCLACKRGHDNQRYALRMGRPFDLRARADQHYRKIMAGQRQRAA